MENEKSPVMTVDEAAIYLKISRPTAFKAIHTNSIPHIRIGRRILVSRAALEKLLANAGAINNED